jgi:hypothetical protein
MLHTSCCVALRCQRQHRFSLSTLLCHHILFSHLINCSKLGLSSNAGCHLHYTHLQQHMNAAMLLQHVPKSRLTDESAGCVVAPSCCWLSRRQALIKSQSTAGSVKVSPPPLCLFLRVFLFGVQPPLIASLDTAHSSKAAATVAQLPSAHGHHERGGFSSQHHAHHIDSSWAVCSASFLSLVSP